MIGRHRAARVRGRLHVHVLRLASVHGPYGLSRYGTRGTVVCVCRCGETRTVRKWLNPREYAAKETLIR